MGRVTRSVGLVALLVLAPLGAAAVGAAAGGATAPAVPLAQSGPNPCVGTVEQQPDNATVVSIQGARGGDKTVAMLAGVRPNGEIIGIHNASANGRWWAYDVDRLANGNFLMATTQNRHTVIEEINDETGEHVSVRDFPDVHDTHDVDLINGDELLMNDMGDEHNRVLIYNLTREEVTWEYRFGEHTDVFPKEGGGPYGDDWTHNNDVEQVRDGVVMVSVRNFDQVAAINRSTKELEWTLGEDNNDTILDEQHNPDYIESEDGRATVIVADSMNDRVAEYTREGDSWNRTWVLRGGGLNEPRDADRLPNGNTLVADRRGHRMVEVNPEGEVLWEVYTPFQPYDVERLGTVDESSGPTMVDAGATGVAEMTGSAVETSDLEACYDYLRRVESSRLVPENAAGPVTESNGDNSEGSDATATEATGGDVEPTDTSGNVDSAPDTESVLGTADDDSSDTSLVAYAAVGLALVVAAGAGLVWWRRTE